MATGTAHFPDSAIRFPPDRFEMSKQRELDRPGRLAHREPDSTRLIERVHHLSINIKLQLRMRGITDTYRPRSFISIQPGYFPLQKPTLAGDTVHDLQLLRTACDSAHQPVAPSACLVVKTPAHQCEQCQGRITHPAKPVIPIS